MQIYKGSEWEEKHDYKKLSMHFLDCPAARRSSSSLRDKLAFGLKDFFNANPNESNFLIEFNLEELKELKDSINDSYNTLKNYLESGEE